MADIPDIPMISITQEDDDDDRDEDDDAPHRDINECHTDIEDVDGPDNDRRRVAITSTSLKIVLNDDDGATDLEDCVDSGDEEEAVPIKDTDISLNEFLDQGCVDESSNVEDGQRNNNNSLKTMSASGKSPSPTAFGLGLPRQSNAGLTDVEDMCTSGDEIEEKHFSEDDKAIVLEDSQGVDISVSMSSHRKLIASNRMNRHPSNSDTESDDESRPKQRQPCVRPKKLSVKTSKKPANIEDAKSDVENMFFDDDLSCARKKSFPVLETPDIEIMAFDGGSDVDDNKEKKNPEINILFHSHVKKTTKKLRKSAFKPSTLLKLPQYSEDALTDIENLNSSDDDENFKVESKNLIPMALVKSDALTDVEDMEDASEEEEDADEKPDIVLPSPLREMTVFCRDENGEPTQETVPLPDSFLLSVNNMELDKGLTDIEDFSEDDDDVDEATDDSADDFEMKNFVDCDSGIVQSSDHTTDMTQSTSSSNLAQACNSSGSRENKERKTCELRRRRKPKTTPTSNAKSNFLDTKFYVDLNASEGHTDVEDMNVDYNEAST